MDVYSLLHRHLVSTNIVINKQNANACPVSKSSPVHCSLCETLIINHDTATSNRVSAVPNCSAAALQRFQVQQHIVLSAYKTVNVLVEKIRKHQVSVGFSPIPPTQ